jgi:hypothetical protein
MADDPQLQLTPKKHALGVGGLALLGTGSCLMWTIVLIPLALPMALIGFVMAIASRFVKTESIVCPACASSLVIEPVVRVAICPQCRTSIMRAAGGVGWVKVS